ncbi:sterol O-acyltransferase 1 [Caerostris darwini]|uniref:O-acyltransferase n=2 Tax=Caerostris TaxID=172845 RepID=A0AAV4V2I9_9ARAC|nr:sterol O-acyltransferase 1 [Caerostris darwini]GIY76261.1 sterol O-acyltransferase 1 [Caerostris extrusa]
MSNGSIEGKQPLSVQPGELRMFLQSLRSDILKDVDTKIIKSIDRLVMELEIKHRKSPNGVTEKPSLSKTTENPKELPPKEFILRNSTLTNLWENAHLRSVYNICLALFVLLYLNITVFYCLNVEKLKKDLAMVSWTFGRFDVVIGIWFAINLSIVFLMYPTFRFWANTRIFVKKQSLYDTLFCTLFVLYEMALILVPSKIIISYNLPPVSSFTVLAEQSRLIMKVHAFVRENINRALRYKPHQDGDQEESQPCPEVEKLIYFLFAPTLVYRDNYPRTTHIRWSNVALNFLQVFCCVIGAYIPCTYFVVDTFNKIGIEPIPLVNFMSTLAMSIFAGGILMFLVFYGMFHCWLNAFAEMLRFGDRMFYDDWWNCTSFAKYYRSWNMVVYDWLYSYIYRDMYVMLGRSRTGAMLVVFMISAIIHEYILALCFKFVFPLLFIMFSTFGVILVFITRRRTSSFWNVFLWGSMFQGWGLLTVFYSLEWYARINCPRTLNNYLDYVVPRSFHCGVISLSS